VIYLTEPSIFTTTKTTNEIQKSKTLKTLIDVEKTLNVHSIRCKCLRCLDADLMAVSWNFSKF
jgi:hypothetical protein